MLDSSIENRKEDTVYIVQISICFGRCYCYLLVTFDNNYERKQLRTSDSIHSFICIGNFGI